MDLQNSHFLLDNQEKRFNGSRAHLSFQSDTGLATQYWRYESFNRTDLRSVSFTFLLATLRWYSAFSCNSCLLTVSFSSSMPLSRSNWRNSKSSKRLVADSRASTFYRHTHAQMDRETKRERERQRQTNRWEKQTSRQTNVPQWHAEEDHSVCQTMFAVWNMFFFLALNAFPEKNNCIHILCLVIIGTKIKKSEVIRSAHHHISELVRRFSKISTKARVKSKRQPYK